jgi:hypothetical protein
MKLKSTLDKVFISFLFTLLIIVNLDNAELQNESIVIASNNNPKCFMETEADTGKPFDQVKFEKDTNEWFNCMENMFSRIKEQQK